MVRFLMTSWMVQYYKCVVNVFFFITATFNQAIALKLKRVLVCAILSLACKVYFLSLLQVNVEYDKFEEGETIIRTAANNWVACRKSGHRRFFVVFTQNKAANFAEINGKEDSLSLATALFLLSHCTPSSLYCLHTHTHTHTHFSLFLQCIL